MARQFDVSAASSRFALPKLTREQIQALIVDLDQDAKDVVIIAIAELWQREIGEPDRDIVGELDELRKRIEMLEQE